MHGTNKCIGGEAPTDKAFEEGADYAVWTLSEAHSVYIFAVNEMEKTV